MRQRSKLLLAGLTAALMLSLAVGSASANRLSVSGRNFSIVWTPLTLTSTELGASIRCNVTLGGSFHQNSITKTVGSLIGYITSAALTPESCTGGTATILTETLPWHVQYGGFTGTLPAITGATLLLIGASFNIDPSGITPACLARTTTTNPARGIANRNTRTGEITGLTADGTASIPLSGGFGCSIFNGQFSGTGAVTPTLSLTLI